MFFTYQMHIEIKQKIWYFHIFPQKIILFRLDLFAGHFPSQKLMFTKILVFFPLLYFLPASTVSCSACKKNTRLAVFIANFYLWCGYWIRIRIYNDVDENTRELVLGFVWVDVKQWLQTAPVWSRQLLNFV